MTDTRQPVPAPTGMGQVFRLPGTVRSRSSTYATLETISTVAECGCFSALAAGRNFMERRSVPPAGMSAFNFSVPSHRHKSARQSIPIVGAQKSTINRIFAVIQSFSSRSRAHRSSITCQYRFWSKNSLSMSKPFSTSNTRSPA